MKRLTTKFIIVFSIIIMLINAINITTFANIDRKNLYFKGECGRLLKKGDIVVKTSIIVYNQDGKEFPAYCLDKDKPGAEEYGSYFVNLDGVIKNVYIWRAITNGYPYKTLEEMGCNSIEEAYMATKMSVYSVLYNYNIDDFSPIGEAGQRTLNALNNIMLKIKDESINQISTGLNIIEENSQWEENEKLTGYISKNFVVESNGPIDTYKVVIEAPIEGLKLTDINNTPKEEFKAEEKFKISIPINQLSDGGSIKIKTTANVETKPIFIGRADDSNNQDYAITGLTYENGSGEKMIYYGKNETKIKIVKKDENGKENLKGAVFQLLNKDKEIVISEIKTNNNGEAIIDNVIPGIYYVKEIQSPAGYILYDGYIQIDSEFNEELTITIKNAKEDIPEINVTKDDIGVKNEVKKLPKTGM